MKKTCLKATSIVVGGGVVVCVRDGGQNDARNRASLPLPGCVPGNTAGCTLVIQVPVNNYN
jgi:hypothetical protein